MCPPVHWLRLRINNESGKTKRYRSEGSDGNQPTGVVVVIEPGRFRSNTIQERDWQG
jgi:hypothetical protein